MNVFKLLSESKKIKTSVDLMTNKSTRSYILQNHIKKMIKGRGIILSISIIAVLGLFIPTSSFAIHNSESMTWQLVMISSYPACSGYHYQMMEKYNDITENYLKLYQMPNTSYKPTCMIEKEFKYNAPKDLDLLILVYDRNKGRADLHQYEIGGIYSHIGKEWTHNHTIIFCDCSNFKYSDPVWILSHELSHFILYYLGYDLSVVEEQIHELDARYDYCAEVEHDPSCYEIKTRMEAFGHDVSVMKPYESAVGQSLFVSEKAEPILDVSFKRDMIAETTSWWLEGKITDEDYLRSLEILSGMTDFENRIAGGFASADRAYVVLTEPPKDPNQDAIEQQMVSEWEEQKTLDIQEMITYTREQKRILTTEEPDKGLPQWFKSRALWWVNGEIDNAEFIAGMEYLYKPMK